MQIYLCRAPKQAFDPPYVKYGTTLKPTARQTISLGVFICLLGGFLAASVARGDDGLAQQVRSILSNRCFACHGPDQDQRQGGFRLDEASSMLTEADSGQRPVVPGEPASSELWRRIMTSEESQQMPPPEFGARLDPQELAAIERWIRQGAQLPMHWSFVPPVRPSLPSVQPVVQQEMTAWNHHPVDRFVIERQVENNLRPSPPATRGELLRRLSLDLTGLPPSPDEVHVFERDKSPDSYERQVNRLLGSPAYGEHWARKWLDLARYADSTGYADDPPRTIWAYRDWVIDALNSDMPVDQFTVEQLAGDLLPNPTLTQLVATAFHRNTLTNNEGGTNDEEFRSVAIVDRVNTTMAVWMGVTMACAQCHTHKYDPFTQEEYFKLYAILNQSEDADRRDESPVIELFTASQLLDKQRLQAEIDAAECELDRLTPDVLAAQAAWEQNLIEPLWKVLEPKSMSSRSQSDFVVDEELTIWGQLSKQHLAILSKPDAQRTETERVDLSKFYSRSIAEANTSLRSKLARLIRQVDGLKPATSVPVLRELAPKMQRETFVQIRGNYKALGAKVTPGMPAVFHPLANLQGHSESVDRLALAQWLVDPNNPLTARVWVNRMWESLFGIGIVCSSEEFGSQGDRPTHPELLDWLACELMQDWDTKRMLRLLVTSETYQQTSMVSVAALEMDRDNVWLARGPRVRLSAEMVRDQALCAAGLQSTKMYGPPVRPPQPNLGLRAAFGSETDWQTSDGEDRYRRGVYTTWRRSNPYPSMATFDAPSREVCTLRRDSTNTPLQALVTLNDPAFVEAAQGLARRIVLYEYSEASDRQRIQAAFELCASRAATEPELVAIFDLLSTTRSHFAGDPAAAKQLAIEPIGPVGKYAKDADQQMVELAAWTSVCNVLLNLDEVLMKR